MTRGKNIKAALVAMIAAAGLVGAAFAVGASGLFSSGRPAPATAESGRQLQPPVLSIHASPKHVSVLPGSEATFQIRVRRGSRISLMGRHGQHRAAARVWFGVRGPLPTGISAVVRPHSTRSQKSVLTVQLDPATAPGTYRIVIAARGRIRPAIAGVVPLLKASESVVLDVPEPASAFEIHGNAEGMLEPGTSIPVNVEISNPQDFAMYASNLTTSIAAVDAPRATGEFPCALNDFSVEQFSGLEPIALPASGTSSLGALGISKADWPRIEMVYRPTNQNGCKDASLTLAFTATSTDGSP